MPHGGSDSTLTRREVVTYGGTIAGAGLLAGCSGSGTNNAGDDASGDGESYSVSISPMGEVSFDSPPETVFTRLTHHADMAFALGHGDSLTAMHAPDYYDGLWNQYVERLPGVELDWTGLYSSWKPSKEKLYALDSDVHLADPAWIGVQDAWDRDDLDEVADSISPWFGNSLSDTHQEPQVDWVDEYEYYGLWEQFGIVAELFQEQERYEALAAIHDEVIATIEADLPAESERPTAVMIAAADIDEIYTYLVDEPGFLNAHVRPFGPRDAYEGTVENNTVIDFETLLEADPDVILHLGGMEPSTDIAARREAFRDDPVASEVAAVQNDRVYAQGARYQGPILNLFQLEMTAKQLYPDIFGEWPSYEEGPYPEIPDEEQLFDRQRVADIINGDL
ncbi:ABC transporter substrate-binding protein [Halonotius terrestris]|uniref:ABC transporter substrate-binding protein n=1 Tax=Halonotius terrestris TaxID=2487750 RepID=A0A8J8TCW5_9EURY|nr:ABC transporter substrate-binding protein [Halonotius terrestris]TQQ81291.1 ABC transporter substrate-binding protein [Halonotius terrestris]